MSNKMKIKEFVYSNLFYAIAVVFIAVFGTIHPKFLASQNIVNIFAQSSVLILVSIGMALALITKGLDMSVGSIVFLCSSTMWILNKNLNIGMAGMMLASLLVGLCAGALNGVIVSILRVYSLLPTLATMFMYRGIALIINGGRHSPMPMFWGRIISLRVNSVPVHVLVAIGLTIIVQLLLNNTKIGRHIYALGDSEKTAHEKGISAFKIRMLVYVISGLMCGIAAIVFSAQSMSVPPSSGQGMEFRCVIAVVLGGVSMFGGKGTVAPGVVVGALLMSLISNVLVVLSAPPHMYIIVYALVILFVVLLDTLKSRKSGLLNKAKIREVTK